MKIVFKDSFQKRLENQIDYISKDSPKRARKFKNDLLSETYEIISKATKHLNPGFREKHAEVPFKKYFLWPMKAIR
jgi:hypothetical protein